MKTKKLLSAITAITIAFSITACANQAEEPTDLAAMLETAQRYLVELDYEQAVIGFEKVIEIDASNAEAYLGLAQAYENSGDLERAADVLDRGYAATGDERLKRELDRLIEAMSPPEETTAATTEMVTEATVPMIEVPELTGLTAEAAEELCASLGLGISITEGESTPEQKGIVILQSIPSGASLPEGVNVPVTVGSGIRMVAVPSIIGMSDMDAFNVLEEAGLLCLAEYVFENSVGDRTVFKQGTAANTMVEAGTEIKFSVAVNLQEETEAVTEAVSESSSYENPYDYCYLDESVYAKYSDGSTKCVKHANKKGEYQLVWILKKSNNQPYLIEDYDSNGNLKYAMMVSTIENYYSPYTNFDEKGNYGPWHPLNAVTAEGKPKIKDGYYYLENTYWSTWGDEKIWLKIDDERRIAAVVVPLDDGDYTINLSDYYEDDIYFGQVSFSLSTGSGGSFDVNINCINGNSFFMSSSASGELRLHFDGTSKEKKKLMSYTAEYSDGYIHEVAKYDVKKNNYDRWKDNSGNIVNGRGK